MTEPIDVVDYAGLTWTRDPLLGNYDCENGDTVTSLAELERLRGPLTDDDTGWEWRA